VNLPLRESGPRYLGTDGTVPVILIRAERNTRKLPVCTHISTISSPADRSKVPAR
jgi:hypothetical protein